MKNQIVNNNTNDKILNNSSNNIGITIEQADNLHYNNEDKKIYLSTYNNKNRSHKKSIKKKKRPSNETKTESNNKKENLYSPKKSEEIKPIYIDNYIQERTIDLFITDESYDIKLLTKTKKKINRKNNKFREIIIENYEPNQPTKKEKFTGFIFIRKSKGKKIYKLELPDDLEKINEIFQNESIMIKNRIIQIVPIDKIESLNNQIQKEIKKSQSEKNLEKELEKEKEIIKDKERQIILLKNKNEELNNTIKKQTKQIAQNEKDMKNIKFNLDQLKDSFQDLDKENKSLKAQLQASKFKRKSIQMQIEEESNQRTLQEMKDRIQKYKHDLRKPSNGDEKENRRKSTLVQNSNNVTQEKEKEKNKNEVKEIVQALENKKKEEKEKNKNSVKEIIQALENQKKEEQNKNKNNVKEIVKALENKRKEERKSTKENEKDNKEEEDYVDDYNYDMYDEKDPKARKMKNAMARFRKKYKDIIIENKKNLKIKENEDKENEELNLNNNELEQENYLIKQKEEQERKELERKEKERKEKEEKEKKEREEKEREEKERKERERREREEKERKEKERKDKERREKEEKERKEKEKKEKREKEEREKKEKEKKEKEKNKLGPFGGGQNKIQNNFAKMLADKMKVGPMPGGIGKTNGASDHNSKPQIIIEKKVDVVNLIQGQEFKRTNKKKPTRIKFTG